jgi:hypothetical protein
VAARDFTGAHASTRADGSSRWLVVCGDYPVVFGATDTGGSVCVDVQLVSAQLSASTLTLSGTSTLADDGTRTFTPAAAASPALASAWLEYDCFCGQLAAQQLDGTLTLRTADAHRLAGELSLTVVATQPTSLHPSSVVHATFDASL